MIPVVRDSRDGDIPAIAAIYADAVETGTASFELTPPDVSEMAQRRMRLLDAGYPYLAAELAGTFAGYAYAGPYHTRPGYRCSVENSIYVASWARRRGVGRVLLSSLISTCTERGFRQMIAIIGDSRHAASIELHRSLGFGMVGTIKDVGYKFDRWLDSVIMQRSLGAGASTPPDP
ncbi:MAG: N-acetyltransferase family protein [Hoeflea sp.]|nr:N-acetyltransferase family protein [Hoeflea sp.]